MNKPIYVFFFNFVYTKIFDSKIKKSFRCLLQLYFWVNG